MRSKNHSSVYSINEACKVFSFISAVLVFAWPLLSPDEGSDRISSSAIEIERERKKCHDAVLLAAGVKVIEKTK